MRIGLLGPADGDEALLREAAEFLLGDCEVDSAVYLGGDEALDAVARSFRRLFFQVNGISFADGFSKEPQLEGLDCHCQRFAFVAYITAIYHA